MKYQKQQTELKPIPDLLYQKLNFKQRVKIFKKFKNTY